ncbi:MAG: sulfite exporter TauE/SafE family protein [Hyphomicrobiaceae bacterium]
MDTTAIMLATMALFAAGVIKGATGLGYASCALPFLASLVGLKPAMAIVVVPAMATNFFIALTAGHLRETVRGLWPLYLAMLPGIALGLWLLVSIDQKLALSALGCVIVLYSVFALCWPKVQIPQAWQSPLQVPAGFLNGLVTGMTGSQVMPLVPYIMGLSLDSTRMVQAINLAVILASFFLGAGLLASGTANMWLFTLSAIGVLPAFAGTAVGSKLRELIPDLLFRRIMLVVLALIGLGLLLRS